MPMPIRDRFIQGLVLSAGGAIIASSAVSPSAVVAKKPPNGGKEQHAAHGLDWEKAPAPKPKRPPNG